MPERAEKNPPSDTTASPIAKALSEYLLAVYGKAGPLVARQRAEVEQAFFTGAAAAFQVVLNAGDPSALAALEREITNFGRRGMAAARLTPARRAFAVRYAKEKGWPTELEKLTTEQQRELMERPEWNGRPS